MKKLYVGNLSYEATEQDLKELFAKFGEIISVKLIVDRYDNSSKGFGFVEFKEDSDGDNAIKELDGTDFKGRNLKVNEAREREGGRDGRGGGNRNGGGNRRREGGHQGGNRW